MKDTVYLEIKSRESFALLKKNTFRKKSTIARRETPCGTLKGSVSVAKKYHSLFSQRI